MNQIDNPKKIAIIGAGISGIAAAMELLDNNVVIDIFEAKNTVGGRIAGIKDNLTGEQIDNGKHLMVGAYTNFFELLKKLGTEQNLYFQKYFRVNFISKTNSFEFKNGNFGKLSQLISLLNLPDLTLKEKQLSLKFIDQVQKNNINFINKTALEILREFKISDKMIEILWKPLILATMNTQPEIASGEIFLNILKLAFFRDNNSARLVFSKIPLQELLLPFVVKFQNENQKIYFSKIVESVKKIGNQFIVKLKDGKDWTYDAVIFALTPFALKKIETNFHIPSLEEFEPSPIVSLYLWSENDFMKEDFYALIGTNFQWIFKETAKSLRYTLTYSAADEIASFSKNEILEIAFKDLELIFPNFKKNNIYHTLVITEKNATIKLTVESQKYRPFQKISNGLYIAGDWTKTGLPATMESAALSGKLASRYLTTDLSL